MKTVGLTLASCRARLAKPIRQLAVLRDNQMLQLVIVTQLSTETGVLCTNSWKMLLEGVFRWVRLIEQFGVGAWE